MIALQVEVAIPAPGVSLLQYVISSHLLKQRHTQRHTSISLSLFQYVISSHLQIYGVHVCVYITYLYRSFFFIIDIWRTCVCIYYIFISVISSRRHLHIHHIFPGELPKLLHICVGSNSKCFTTNICSNISFRESFPNYDIYVQEVIVNVLLHVYIVTHLSGRASQITYIYMCSK